MNDLFYNEVIRLFDDEIAIESEACKAHLDEANASKDCDEQARRIRIASANMTRIATLNNLRNEIIEIRARLESA